MQGTRDPLCPLELLGTVRKKMRAHSKLFVVADRVQFIGAPKRTGEYTDTPGGDAATPAKPAAKPFAPVPAPPAATEESPV